VKTQLPKSIRNNLRFLIIEVGTQVSSLLQFIGRTENILSANILDRSGYTANLKQRIHNGCYQHMLQAGHEPSDVVAYRAIKNIATNLERIAELCRDCAHHATELGYKRDLYTSEYIQLLDRVALSISLIERATLESSSQQALEIGKVQQYLNQSCDQLIAKHETHLISKKNTEGLISSIFVVKSIKSMGDALLKICEAILSGNLGQAISLDRYHSLNGFVEQLQGINDNAPLVIDTLAETRSGSAISGISKADAKSTEIIAVFKDGKKRKLKEELESVKHWNKLYPGIAPKILSYHKKGESAALLIEHLDGYTFENILLEGSLKLQQKAIQQLGVTLVDIWQKTYKKKSVNGLYMGQLQKRLKDVYAIHPSFKQGNCHIAGLRLASFEYLIMQAAKIEAVLSAPFSVQIHGDFNTDNIIYDPKDNKINFIDLHRSRKMDYVQDISVFMVSNYRLQALGGDFNRRVLLMNQDIYKFAEKFAQQHKDDSFDVRLSLGLARSLATSPRFTLDKTLAKAMFYRSRYLIEQIVNLKTKNYTAYKTPIKEIFLG